MSSLIAYSFNYKHFIVSLTISEFPQVVFEDTSVKVFDHEPERLHAVRRLHQVRHELVQENLLRLTEAESRLFGVPFVLGRAVV